MTSRRTILGIIGAGIAAPILAQQKSENEEVTTESNSFDEPAVAMCVAIDADSFEPIPDAQFSIDDPNIEGVVTPQGCSFQTFMPGKHMISCRAEGYAVRSRPWHPDIDDNDKIFIRLHKS